MRENEGGDQRPPSVDAVVQRVDHRGLPRPLVVETVRQVVDAARQDPDLDIDREVGRRLVGLRRSAPRRVINATGVMLHTNLGRAPWAPEALAAASEVAAAYSNVELDMTTGERGHRNAAAERLAAILTGAEAALVVNNNAGAVFLSLLALAQGRPVPVSRGELIEIGGSYRLPELMAAAGAFLVEVGTTNRTRLADYEAVSEPALLLKVHPSNYQVVGFTSDTPVEELADLARERRVPLVYDVGSGLLDERTPWLGGPPPGWLSGEPGVRQSLERGADLVTFSGDKLLGGPQAGVIVGREDLVHRLRSHPAARALRVDGTTTAALAATLAAYLAGQGHELPIWIMAMLSTDEIESRAQDVLSEAGVEGRIIDGASTMGAGSAPGAEIPTRLIEIPSGQDLHAQLLGHDPPVLGRRSAGSLILDLRTVAPHEDAVVASALGSQ